MRFKDTRNNLDALERLDRPIRAEELYELLYLVMEDVYSASGALDASSLVCGDKAALAQTVRYVLGDAAKAARDSMEGIRELSEQSQKEWGEIFQEAVQTETELDEASRALREVEQLRARREKAYRQLKKEQAELLEIKADCERMREEIDRLSDSALQGLEEERGRLRSELAARQAEAAGIRGELDSLGEALARANKERTAALSDKAVAASERKRLERQLQSAKEEIEAEKQRIAEADALLKTLEERESALLTAAASYTSLFNALNAVVNEPFVSENIFCLSGGGEKEWRAALPRPEREIKSAKDLKEWMDAAQGQIEALLGAYRSVLQRAVELSGKLTGGAG